MLTIPLSKLTFIIEKAREFDAEVPSDDADQASNAADDNESAILLDTPDNGTEAELRDAIEGLNDDEKIELLALTWLGRGDYDREEWKDALREARHAVNKSEADYLIGTPLLSDYLEEAVETLGLSLDEFEIGRL